MYKLFLLVLTIFLLSSLCFSEEAVKTKDPLVATMLGVGIRYSDIQYDPNDKYQKDFYNALMALINKVRNLAFEDFKKINNLEATEDEINQFWKGKSLDLKDFESEDALKKYQKEYGKKLIELQRLCEALYKKYGGIVKMTKIGPDPVGAHYKLLKEYKDHGFLKFYNNKFEHHFWKELARKPKYIVPTEKVDFKFSNLLIQ